MKRLFWIASSKTDWNTFPASVKAEGGYQLDKVQRGEEPSDWKPMSNIGVGIREIRIREASGAFRMIYLATRPEGIYVLHVFQKKTRSTSTHDIRLARERFKTLSE